MGWDFGPSLERVRTLAGQILAASPDDPDGRALQGLARVVELRAPPPNGGTPSWPCRPG